MAMKAAEVKAWLATIPDDEDVAIDEGGLCLEANSGDWCEIGGWPEPEEVTCPQCEGAGGDHYCLYCEGRRTVSDISAAEWHRQNDGSR